MGSSAVRVSFGERISLGRYERRFLRSWWWRHADQRGFPHDWFANHGFLLRCLHRRRSFGSRLLWGGGLLGGNRFLQNLFRWRWFLSRRGFFHGFLSRCRFFHRFLSGCRFFHRFLNRCRFFHHFLSRRGFFHGFLSRCGLFHHFLNRCGFFHCFLNRRCFFCRNGFFRGFFRGTFRRHDGIFFGEKGYAPCLCYVGGSPLGKSAVG